MPDAFEATLEDVEESGRRGSGVDDGSISVLSESQDEAPSPLPPRRLSVAAARARRKSGELDKGNYIISVTNSSEEDLGKSRGSLYDAPSMSSGLGAIPELPNFGDSRDDIQKVAGATAAGSSAWDMAWSGHDDDSDGKQSKPDPRTIIKDSNGDDDRTQKGCFGRFGFVVLLVLVVLVLIAVVVVGIVYEAVIEKEPSNGGGGEAASQSSKKDNQGALLEPKESPVAVARTSSTFSNPPLPPSNFADLCSSVEKRQDCDARCYEEECCFIPRTNQIYCSWEELCSEYTKACIGSEELVQRHQDGWH